MAPGPIPAESNCARDTTPYCMVASVAIIQSRPACGGRTAAGSRTSPHLDLLERWARFEGHLIHEAARPGVVGGRSACFAATPRATHLRGREGGVWAELCTDDGASAGIPSTLARSRASAAIADRLCQPPFTRVLHNAQ